MKRMAFIFLLCLTVIVCSSCDLLSRVSDKPQSLNTDKIPREETADHPQLTDNSITRTEAVTTEESDSGVTAIDSDMLVGMWFTAARDVNNFITIQEYSFNADGTFMDHFYQYIFNTSNDSVHTGLPEGWIVGPMGWPSYFGTYEVKDSTIILTYTGCSIPDQVDEPWTRELKIVSLSPDSAVFSGIQASGFNTEDEYTLFAFQQPFVTSFEEIVEKTGVDTTPPSSPQS